MSISERFQQFEDWQEIKNNDSQRMINFKVYLGFFMAYIYFTIAAFIIAFLIYFVWPHLLSFFKLLFNL